MVTVYGIKNCGSVKKALTFLTTHKIEYTFVDFKTTPVDSKKISEWCDKSDLSLLLNTKGTTYKNLDLKSLDLSNNDKIEWMTKENRLIKRPVIEYGSNVIIGFNQTQYEGLFLP
ncbi:MAG: arsenate reductase family protein [Sulfuricurvum sp.]|uniref:arsenate reductase family protein n=1 Tax=Sulfuricurvum sp. TaxID=2025608 RepID=UPI00261F2821|nr:arsenate reductase family protein [Sulfuricurvum sp.]MDD2829081.1 arsenate reductase family protein [Sulfuricurvum sp.]MDD4948829.1 arsenate reductase family protein [Sulfuricurvum sp.]